MSRQDSRAVERTAAAMETLVSEGVEQVSVARVLQLLGREAPEPPRPAERPERIDPRADPLTGCMPVTAPGGQHGDTEEGRGGRGFRG